MIGKSRNTFRSHCRRIVRLRPPNYSKFVILHARTNATVRTNWEKLWINRSTEDFHQWILPRVEIAISTSTLIDNNKAVLMVKHLKNDLMNTTCSRKTDSSDNRNIMDKHLSRWGLHKNKTGINLLKTTLFLNCGNFDVLWST